MTDLRHGWDGQGWTHVFNGGLAGHKLYKSRRNQDWCGKCNCPGQVEKNTLYQVSTATALVEGIYQGAIRIADLREHGDLGLGTFENLDGEMVILDGHFFQVRCDGSVTEVADDLLSPFAVVTQFFPDPAVTLDECPDMKHLTSRFDSLRQSDNVFFALRVDGQFEYVHTRAMCRTQEGVPLIRAAAVQPEFEFRTISGTLVGSGLRSTQRPSTCPAITCTLYRTTGNMAVICCNAAARICGFRFSERVTITSLFQKLRIF